MKEKQVENNILFGFFVFVCVCFYQPTGNYSKHIKLFDVLQQQLIIII